jgi:hypothetical protein
MQRCDVPTLHISQVMECLLHHTQIDFFLLDASRMPKHADSGLPVLSVDRERPRGHAAQNSNEVSPVHRVASLTR